MTELRNPNTPTQPPIAGRGGTSQIGTTNPNSGSVGNTGSSYAPGAYTSGITPLDPSVTTYQINDTDYQGFILFDTASAVTVTLNSAVQDNFTVALLNLGSGAITLAPDAGLTVNGASTLTMASHQGCNVYFAIRNWYAFVGTTFIPVLPATFAPVTGEYLTGYNASTGVFSASTPAGISGTITTAKLTTGGTNGSQTFTNGILTAQVAAT